MPRITFNRLTFGIMLGLIAWGIYLAVGATGMFVQRSLLDPRKSAVVLLFVGLFLLLWTLAIRGSQRKITARSTSAAAGETLAWNRAALASVGFGVCGIIAWWGAVVSWRRVSPQSTTLLGWTAAALLCLSVTLGVTALSDRSGRRGTWLGLLALLACGAALFVFFLRMTP